MGNRFIASLRSASSQFGDWGWGIASLLHSVPLHRDLGIGVGESLHCFTPFRFIAIWGRGLAEAISRKRSAIIPHMEAVCRYIIWKPSTSQKETSPLAHFVRNSLPHKSFRFCSPMQNKWKPENGNHHIAKRNFPSCSFHSQFTASQKLPLLFPNAKQVETRSR